MTASARSRRASRSRNSAPAGHMGGLACHRYDGLPVRVLRRGGEVSDGRPVHDPVGDAPEGDHGAVRQAHPPRHLGEPGRSNPHGRRRSAWRCRDPCAGAGSGRSRQALETRSVIRRAVLRRFRTTRNRLPAWFTSRWEDWGRLKRANPIAHHLAAELETCQRRAMSSCANFFLCLAARAAQGKLDGGAETPSRPPCAGAAPDGAKGLPSAG